MIESLNNLSNESKENELSQNNISMRIKSWFLSCNAKNIRRLYFIFVLFSGLLVTAYSVLIRLEMFDLNIKYIISNPYFYAIIAAYTILMIFCMVMSAVRGDLNNLLLPLVSKFTLTHILRLLITNLIIRVILITLLYVSTRYFYIDKELLKCFIYIMLISYHIYRYRSLENKLPIVLYLLDITLSFLLINLFFQFIIPFLELSNGLLLMADSDGGSDSNSSNGSDSSNGGNSSNNSNNGPEGGSEGVPDLHSAQSLCTHDSWGEYTDTSEESLLNSVCDLNPSVLPNGSLESHPAFNDGNIAYVCNNCHILSCYNCLNPNYLSDISLTDSSSGEENSDNDNN